MRGKCGRQKTDWEIPPNLLLPPFSAPHYWSKKSMCWGKRKIFESNIILKFCKVWNKASSKMRFFNKSEKKRHMQSHRDILQEAPARLFTEIWQRTVGSSNWQNKIFILIKLITWYHLILMTWVQVLILSAFYGQKILGLRKVKLDPKWTGWYTNTFSKSMCHATLLSLRFEKYLQQTRFIHIIF